MPSTRIRLWIAVVTTLGLALVGCTRGGETQSADYQAFAVLTMCRDLYVLEHGVVVSKPAAAAWAARRLRQPWPALVERELGWRTDERPDDRQLPETMRFVAHAVELARSAG